MSSGKSRWFLVVCAVLFLAGSACARPSTATAGTVGFGYDDVGRLVQATDPSTNSASYKWDAVGNLQSITRQSSTTVSIRQVTPGSAPVGATVRIYGTGFSTTATQDAVTFNGTSATVAQASAWMLVVKVPTGATSGSVKVTAPGGSATSSSVFTVSSNAAPSISGVSFSGGTATVSGSNFDPSAPNNALLLGTTRLSVSLATATSLTAKLPASYGSGLMRAATPNGTTSGSGFCRPFGTLDQCSSTSVGTGTQVTVSTAGHFAELWFDGKAGERVFVDVSNSTLSGGTMELVDPAGDYYIANQPWGYIDATTLPVTGTYTLILKPANTGTATVTVRDAPADASYQVTPSLAGAPVNVSTVRGQGASVTFQATAGQRIFVSTSNWAYTGSVGMVMYEPDGTTFVTGTWTGNGSYADSGESQLPSTGSYRVALNPLGTSSGSATVTFRLVPADASYSVTPTQAGAPVNVATGTPGQNATVTFSQTAGQHVFVGVSNCTYGTRVNETIYNPDGSTVISGSFACSDTWAFDLKAGASGAYKMLVDPSAAGTGGVKLTFYQVPPDTTGSISIGGSPVTVTLGTPGQNGWLSFSGTAGKAIKVTASNVTISSSNVNIFNPDNSKLASGAIGTSGGTVSATLTQTGTHWIQVDPQGPATGSMTVTLTDPPSGAAARTATRSSQQASPASTAGVGVGALGPMLPTHPPDDAGPATPRARALASPAKARRPLFKYRPSHGASWVPGRRNRHGDWRVHAPSSPWTTLVPLSAPGQGTELAGQALQLNGSPLAGVRVSVAGFRAHARTDATGRFLLTHLPSGGHHVLSVDGSAAGTRGRRYSSFEIGVDLKKHRETVLPFTLWIPQLDRGKAVRVSSPTRRAITLRTRRIPGLEVRIPAHSTITGASGKPIKHLTVVPVPVDRPPFPLPMGSAFPIYLSVQPAGAYVSRGAAIVYPNYGHLPAGQRVPFWNYDPTKRGWYVYGSGRVTKDGKRIVPDPHTRLWQFTGAMVASTEVPPTFKNPSEEPTSSGADPVNLASGLFTYRKTDLQLPDVLPIRATRIYRPADANSYSFGIGMSSAYDMRLFSQSNYFSAELILPDGMDVHYDCVSNCGTTWNLGLVYRPKNPPAEFAGSQITVDQATGGTGGAFALRLRNGLTYFFSEELSFGLQAIRDRFGNQLEINRDGAGNATQVTAPHGRWIAFQYDTNNRVTQATDSAGRIVKYAYDTAGRLSQVTDANNGLTTYTYDPTTGWMTRVTTPRGSSLVANVYDANGRVTQQTIGNEANPYRFSYVLDSGGHVTQSTMTSPTGSKTVTNFNADGYATSQTLASGTSLAETTTFQRQPGTNLVTSETDTLGRTTSYAYDSHGNATTVTRMSGTAGARTTTIAYDQTFSVPTQVTDAAGNVSKNFYDGKGELTQVTDALGKTTTIAYANQDGEATSVTDPLGNKTTYGYVFGDPSTTTNPALGVTAQYLDAGGRRVLATDAVGARTRYGYDPLNDQTTVTDAAGRVTTFGYDADGNLTSLKDANAHSTAFTYDAESRLHTRTDALGHQWTYDYDDDGNLTTVTDGKGQKATYQPDALGRVAFAGFTAAGGSTYESTITYTYDLADRLVKAIDSAAGTFNRTWDNFDELTQESGPNGSIAYTFDADGRRHTSTVTGQPQVTYGYDAGSHLTSIGGSGQTVTIGYDAAGRRLKTVLPNAISENYTYDAASRVTDIVYKSSGGSTLGDLHYAYDPAGSRVSESGSYENVTIPQSWGAATYNADNALVSAGSKTYSYDANGNLTGDGTSTYTWNARNLLASVGGTTSASYLYDPFGRRAQRTAGGTTTGYLYDGQNVAQEVSGGTARANYLLGLANDQRFSRTDSGGTVSYLTDVAGSTLALSNSTGSLPTTYAYEPFGQTTLSGVASTNPYQYGGRENDGGGLQYNRARYYSPGTAQFISRDPLGFAGSGPALYAYASGDPMDHADPSGLHSVGDDLANFAMNAAASVLSGGKDSGGGGEDIAPGEGGSGGRGGEPPQGGRAPPSGEEPPENDSVVLGHYPEYLQTAEQVGGRTFNVPEEVWNAMSPEEQWAANQRFLDRAIARGSDFELATPAEAAREGSFYERELQYLTSKGYSVGPDGTTMIPPGG
jgi:RHS repeat-associated protein